MSLPARCRKPPPKPPLPPQSVANKGEPFLSGIGPSREAVAAALAPHGLGLREFLTPKDMVGKVCKNR